MMRTIWPLEIDSEASKQDVAVPIGSQILEFKRMKNGRLFLYVLVDPTAPSRTITIWKHLSGAYKEINGIFLGIGAHVTNGDAALFFCTDPDGALLSGGQTG